MPFAELTAAYVTAWPARPRGTAVDVDILDPGPQSAFVRVCYQRSTARALRREKGCAQPAFHRSTSPRIPMVGVAIDEHAIVFAGIGSPRQGELLQIAQTDRTLAPLSGAAQRRNEDRDQYRYNPRSPPAARLT